MNREEMRRERVGKVTDLLFRAADRVQFQGWTQHTYAVAADGEAVKATTPVAVAWCARGALLAEKRPYRLFDHALTAVESYLGVGSLMLWNDWKGRTAGEVADTMRRCAKELLETA